MVLQELPTYYTVMLQDPSFAVSYLEPTAYDPVIFRPQWFNDPGEACNEFEVSRQEACEYLDEAAFEVKCQQRKEIEPPEPETDNEEGDDLRQELNSNYYRDLGLHIAVQVR